MVFFSDETVTAEVHFAHYLARLSNVTLDDTDEFGEQPLGGLAAAAQKQTSDLMAESQAETSSGTAKSDASSPFGAGAKHEATNSIALSLQRDVAAILQPYFDASHGLVVKALEFAATLEHIMDFTRARALNALFSMLNKAVRNVFAYNHSHSELPMRSEQLEKYIRKYLVYAILWSFAGDAKLKARYEMGEFIRGIPMLDIDLPPKTSNLPIIDFEVSD